MTTIRVATEILAAKERNMRMLCVDYSLALQENFNAGPVDVAYDNLNGKWKEHQVQISTSVDRIADILKAIREAFEQLEDQLTASLASGSSPGASPGSAP